MKQFLTIAFCVLQLGELFAIWLLLSRYDFVNPSLYDLVQKQGTLDVLHVASQIGRFDMISIMLSFWGLFIGVAALAGFWTIRGAAISAARETAEVQASRVSAETAKSYLEENAVRLFGEVRSVSDRPDSNEKVVGSASVDEIKVINNAQELRPGDV